MLQTSHLSWPLPRLALAPWGRWGWGGLPSLLPLAPGSGSPHHHTLHHGDVDSGASVDTVIRTCQHMCPHCHVSIVSCVYTLARVSPHWLLVWPRRQLSADCLTAAGWPAAPSAAAETRSRAHCRVSEPRPGLSPRLSDEDFFMILTLHWQGRHEQTPATEKLCQMCHQKRSGPCLCKQTALFMFDSRIVTFTDRLGLVVCFINAIAHVSDNILMTFKGTFIWHSVHCTIH